MILHFSRNLQYHLNNLVHPTSDLIPPPRNATSSTNPLHKTRFPRIKIPTLALNSILHASTPRSPKCRTHRILHIQLLLRPLLKALNTHHQHHTFILNPPFPTTRKETSKTHPPQILHRLVQRRRKHIPNIAEQALMRLQLEFLAQKSDEHFEAVRSRQHEDGALRERPRAGYGLHVDADWRGVSYGGRKERWQIFG